ncbi:hypothetical protein CPB84DRAFT_1778584 [Gymnopilus junonius]|uniref:Uncharacterized protein n=1 Tax=Gymnopilus junonius TaxID=109634 RepID=A0A9P5N6J5_GYMJU|nr:hypothetical protein CPB84DRAFT_1809129 [Gymnopilus junonius]KAF8900879.1 hypothetical protein CPB84DRAFT_1778584 [Gymnopilus junonius]
MPKQRSKKQRVQAAFNITKLHANWRKQNHLGDDLELENIDPRQIEIELLQRDTDRQKLRAERNAQKLRNKTKEAERAERMRDILREENRSFTPCFF